MVRDVISPGGGVAPGSLAAVVAEIEMEEFERQSRFVPVFLWLWEHREEVRRLLAAGTTWEAIAAAIVRLGVAEEEGPGAAYCRVAWNRVTSYEPRVLGKRRPLHEAELAPVAMEPALAALVRPTRRGTLADPPALELTPAARRLGGAEDGV